MKTGIKFFDFTNLLKAISNSIYIQYDINNFAGTKNKTIIIQTFNVNCSLKFYRINHN